MTTSLAHHVVLDLPSGTFFGADNAYLLDTRRIPSDDLELFNEGNDSDRREIAERYGFDLEQVLAQPSQTLHAIAALLNGHSWSSDDLNEIADLLRHVGFVIDEPTP